MIPDTRPWLTVLERIAKAFESIAESMLVISTSIEADADPAVPPKTPEIVPRAPAPSVTVGAGGAR